MVMGSRHTDIITINLFCGQASNYLLGANLSQAQDKY